MWTQTVWAQSPLSIKLYYLVLQFCSVLFFQKWPYIPFNISTRKRFYRNTKCKVIITIHGYQMWDQKECLEEKCRAILQAKALTVSRSEKKDQRQKLEVSTTTPHCFCKRHSLSQEYFNSDLLRELHGIFHTLAQVLGSLKRLPNFLNQLIISYFHSGSIFNSSLSFYLHSTTVVLKIVPE